MTRDHARLLWWYGCAVIYLWCFAAQALTAYRHPLMMWDMVAYMGVVETYKTADPETAYADTMKRVDRIFSDRSYDQIARKNVLSNNAEAFRQQMPFYRIKPLYTGAMYALERFAAIPTFLATYGLSIFGWLALGALFFFCRPNSADAGAWWLALAAFAFVKPSSLAVLAAFPTPDLFAMAFFFSGFFLWLLRRSAIGFGAGVLLAQLARPDMLLLILALLAFFALLAPPEYRMRRRDAAIIGGIGLGLYVLVGWLAESYGWRGLFYYHFMRRSAYPANVTPDFGWQEYRHFAGIGLLRMAENMRVQGLLALSAAALLCHWRRPHNVLWPRLLLVTWAALLARVLIFPAWTEYRYYWPFYLIIFFCAVEMLASAFLAVYRKRAEGLAGGHQLDAVDIDVRRPRHGP